MMVFNILLSRQFGHPVVAKTAVLAELLYGKGCNAVMEEKICIYQLGEVSDELLYALDL